MYHRRIFTGRTAFTLIELLVVITIIAILAALILPILSRVQAKGNETKTISNMRVMGMALMAFAGDNSYQLPGRVAPPAAGAPTTDKWPIVLQPYIQDLTVYGAPLPDVGGKPYKMANPPKPYPQVYLSNDTNYTSYIYNGGNDVAPNTGPVIYPRLNTFAQPAKTILLGVPNPQANNFYMDFTEGNNSQILNKQAFLDGTPYVFADGSARVLAVDTAVSNTTEPISSGTYSDWLWLFDKSQTSIIH